MDIIQEVIELWNRGEFDAATLLIDGEEQLLEMMQRKDLNHESLIEYLIARNAGK